MGKNTQSENVAGALPLFGKHTTNPWLDFDQLHLDFEQFLARLVTDVRPMLADVPRMLSERSAIMVRMLDLIRIQTHVSGCSTGVCSTKSGSSPKGRLENPWIMTRQRLVVVCCADNHPRFCEAPPALAALAALGANRACIRSDGESHSNPVFDDFRVTRAYRTRTLSLASFDAKQRSLFPTGRK